MKHQQILDKAIARADRAIAAGMTATGGTFATYLSRLKSNGVAEKWTDGWRLAEVLR